jgi:glycosyltransferase involved in cell wall biosynthesis
MTTTTTTGGSMLLITPRWARDGGVGAHVEMSAGLLAASGFRVTVLAARIESSHAPAGVTLMRSPELFDLSVPAQRRVGDALAQSPELVHLHEVSDPDVVRAARAVAPVVISAHGFTACTSGVHYFKPGEECSRPHGSGCVPNILLRGCAHARNPLGAAAQYGKTTRRLEALALSDLAVSYSTAIDRHLAQNGIASRALVPYFPTMALPGGAPFGERRRVVFAGRVVAPKGVHVLIRAAREVDAEFVVCGDGRQLEAMRRLARRLGVGERVRFTGWLDGEALAEELAAASVVAVPSVWPEPFGLVGIEAHAAGRPVVASATGGIADWLEDGVSGLTVAPGDDGRLAAALNALLTDPARSRAMGEAGRRSVAARFSPERHIEALSAAYRTARSAWEATRLEVTGGIRPPLGALAGEA